MDALETTLTLGPMKRDQGTVAVVPWTNAKIVFVVVKRMSLVNGTEIVVIKLRGTCAQKDVVPTVDVLCVHLNQLDHPENNEMVHEKLTKELINLQVKIKDDLQKDVNYTLSCIFLSSVSLCQII